MYPLECHCGSISPPRNRFSTLDQSSPSSAQTFAAEIIMKSDQNQTDLLTVGYVRFAAKWTTCCYSLSSHSKTSGSKKTFVYWEFNCKIKWQWNLLWISLSNKELENVILLTATDWSTVRQWNKHRKKCVYWGFNCKIKW